jgi:hypothetical protein
MVQYWEVHDVPQVMQTTRRTVTRCMRQSLPIVRTSVGSHRLLGVRSCSGHGLLGLNFRGHAVPRVGLVVRRLDLGCGETPVKLS